MNHPDTVAELKAHLNEFEESGGLNLLESTERLITIARNAFVSCGQKEETLDDFTHYIMGCATEFNRGSGANLSADALKNALSYMSLFVLKHSLAGVATS